jgi:hypothetical protein
LKSHRLSFVPAIWLRSAAAETLAV